MEYCYYMYTLIDDTLGAQSRMNLIYELNNVSNELWMWYFSGNRVCHILMNMVYAPMIHHCFVTQEIPQTVKLHIKKQKNDCRGTETSNP